MAGVSETRTIDAVLSTTLAALNKELYDQIFDDYPLISWLNGKLGVAMRGSTVKKIYPGGETITGPVLYEENSTVDSFTGAEVIDSTLQDGMTHFRYNWKQYAATIGITGHDKRVNRGEAQIIDLLGGKTTQAVLSFKKRLNEDAYKDGTGNGGKDLVGLAAHIAATGTTGGLNQTTFSWWASDAATSSSFAANGRDTMTTMFNTLSFGNDKVDIIFTDQTNFERYEKLVDARERYVNEKALNIGFENLMFKSVPIIFDRDCTAGKMYFLNSRYIHWAVLAGADMAVEPFQSGIDQDVILAKLILEANIVVTNRRNHGILTVTAA